jgi:hypothetical protein
MRDGQSAAISTNALALIDKWRAQGGVHPGYIEGWRAALEEGPEGVERIALTNTQQAEALRHCMPFAGILSNRERLEFRRMHVGRD